VRDELSARAARQGKSMQEYLRSELERLAARPSIDAWLGEVRRRKSAALIDTGRDGIWAEGLVSRGPLFGPELVAVETTNILRRLERAKRITTLEASSAHQDLQRLDIELFPSAPFADRVWELRHALTSYDAWYVALAEALRLPLATLDLRLTRVKGAACEFWSPGVRDR
jgi:predicted nucleic acid-binding protein